MQTQLKLDKLKTIRRQDGGLLPTSFYDSITFVEDRIKEDWCDEVIQGYVDELKSDIDCDFKSGLISICEFAKIQNVLK